MLTSRRFRALSVFAAGAALALPLATGAPAQAAAPVDLVGVQLLNINDFHGNLEPPSGSGGRALDDAGVVRDAGGAVYLATHVKQLQADRAQEHSVMVAAGDLVGASPLVSALFHDEPTIQFLTSLGVFASSTGNHEYDEGIDELHRLQDGGCHPTDGCLDGDGFAGAGFTYLSANVTDEAGNLVMPAYAVKTLEPGLEIGFIGAPLQDTPSIVTASGVAGLKFTREVNGVNKAVKALRARGVQSIVLMVHQGDNVLPGALPNDCGLAKQPDGSDGPATVIAKKVSPEIDVVFAGHSHQAYNCTVDDPLGNPRPVVQGASFGRFVSEVDLQIDRRTKEVRRDLTTADNHLVTRDVAPDPAAQALVERYKTLAAPIANRQVATITGDLTRSPSPAGEQPLGDVIADAQLAATDGVQEGGAVAAFMNPGGIRADLTYAGSPAGEGDGVVTYGEAFTVQPFTNYLTTMTYTGAQIDRVLEQQWDNPSGVKVLQVSNGFSYAWSAGAPVGSRVDPASITIGGSTVDPDKTYRITVNSFLAGGGDGFSELARGKSPLVGAIDLDSFVGYGTEASPIAPPAPDRITVLP